MKANILVVGGGFAGFWAAVAARRVAGARADICLVSREPVLQVRPRLYEANPASLVADLRAPLSLVDVKLICDEAVELDHRRAAVALRSGVELSYDRLVVATGSVMRRPPIAGASEAYSIDTVRDAVELDHRLMEISRRQQPTIAIVGAGFTGIELALEMRDRLAWYKPDRAQTARVVLLDRSSVVGPELGPGPRPFIISALEQASVETRLEQRITALGRDWVLFESGERLQADAVVVCTGLVAAPFTASVPGPKDALGRILVDKTLRSPLEGIFAAGDACAADAGDGHVTLLSCQHALQLGRFAGENAARSLTGLPLLRYQQPDYVTCLDLGRSGAVFTRGWNRAVGTAGAEAKALKREINTIRIYPPTGSRDSLLDASQIGGRSALSDAA